MARLVLIAVLLSAAAVAQGGQVRGVVLGPRGAISNALISVQSAADATAEAKPMAITDAKGEFHFKQAPGKWRLCATAAGLSLYCTVVDLVASGSIDLKLTLAKGAESNPLPQSVEDNPLQLYAGKWASTSHMYATQFSREQEISAKLTCAWTPDSKFLICDQVITDPKGTHNQLTVYSYNAEEKVYVYSTFPAPGAQPNFAKLEIAGRNIVYSGSAERDGKRTLFRTTNSFSAVDDRYTFVAEFSIDDGAHWTKMLEGAATRIAQ